MSLMTDQVADFHSGHYLGRQFALLRHHRTWRVFLDQKLLEPYAFETAEDAAAWLRRKIEDRLN